MMLSVRPFAVALLVLLTTACGDSATAPAEPTPIRGTVVARVFSPIAQSGVASGDSVMTTLVVRATSAGAADDLFACSDEASFQITPRTEVRGLSQGVSITDALEDGAVVDVWPDSNFPVLLMCTPSMVAARVDLVRGR